MGNEIFPTFLQGEADCGAACIKIICDYYKREYSIDYLRVITKTQSHVTSLECIIDAFEKIGFIAFAVEISLHDLKINRELLPIIVHWGLNHFLVVYEISDEYIYVSDPAIGYLTHMDYYTFNQLWNKPSIFDINALGIAVLLTPY